MIARPCLGPGPYHLALPGTSRCAQHSWRGNWPTTPPEQRGYGYEWRKVIRPAILKRDHYLCQVNGPHCARKATAVDHITPKSQGGSDDDSNLQAICQPCHDEKTRRDNPRLWS